MKEPIQNALTIDVEDYFQVAALAEAVRYDDWSSRRRTFSKKKPGDRRLFLRTFSVRR